MYLYVNLWLDNQCLNMFSCICLSLTGTLSNISIVYMYIYKHWKISFRQFLTLRRRVFPGISSQFQELQKRYPFISIIKWPQLSNNQSFNVIWARQFSCDVTILGRIGLTQTVTDLWINFSSSVKESHICSQLGGKGLNFKVFQEAVNKDLY